MKMTISFPLIRNANGTVSLGEFNNGAAIMEFLASLNRDHDMPENTEIRLAVEPRRKRGRHKQFMTMDASSAGKAVMVEKSEAKKASKPTLA